MTTPRLNALAGHRHHVFESPGHGLKPAGNLIVGRLEAPDTAALGLQIDEKLIALVGQKTYLLLKNPGGGVAVSIVKNLLQATFKLINGRIEPPRCLLQSLWFIHRVRPSPFRRRRFIPRLRAARMNRQPVDTLVTLCSVFIGLSTTLFSENTRKIDSAARRVI